MRTGTTVADSSSSGNNGTFTGAPAWVTGAKSFSPFALNFHGSPDLVNVGVNGLPALDHAKSVSLWFNYPTAPTTSNKTFFSFTDAVGCGIQQVTR